MDLRFDNRFVRELPADPIADNYRRAVHEACFSRVQPTPVAAPKWIAWSAEMATALGLGDAMGRDGSLLDALAGNGLLDGMEPFASCYGGHQFGNWAGQLGDGRAISLGETLHDDGTRWELQLKGAGPTPYSRMGDGRAVMRSSVREFLCSEAMHHLGVPTTRALSLVSTGDAVVRDMFYDGNAGPEPGAIVCRVAPTFLRFGNFQLLAARRDEALLRRLADYTITQHFSHLGRPSPQVYVAWLREVIARTVEMIVGWMRVGFVHGVMNTDNMSILGLTVDYGPYGWLDNYDPNWTPNTTDAQGRRYRYGHQPSVAGWNLLRFAECLVPLVGAVEPIQEALDGYSEQFAAAELAMMAAKIGLATPTTDDTALINDLVEVLQLVETDMTLFYRGLADVPVGDCAATERLKPLNDAYYDADNVTADVKERTLSWLQRYHARLTKEARDPQQRRAAMNRTNPRFVLRNYLAQLAIDEAEKGDGSKVMELLDTMRRPYDDQPDRAEFAAKRPEWARHRPGCSMLSCSS